MATYGASLSGVVNMWGSAHWKSFDFVMPWPHATSMEGGSGYRFLALAWLLVTRAESDFISSSQYLRTARSSAMACDWAKSINSFTMMLVDCWSSMPWLKQNIQQLLFLSLVLMFFNLRDEETDYSHDESRQYNESKSHELPPQRALIRKRCDIYRSC